MARPRSRHCRLVPPQDAGNTGPSAQPPALGPEPDRAGIMAALRLIGEIPPDAVIAAHFTERERARLQRLRELQARMNAPRFADLRDGGNMPRPRDPRLVPACWAAVAAGLLIAVVIVEWIK